MLDTFIVANVTINLVSAAWTINGTGSDYGWDYKYDFPFGTLPNGDPKWPLFEYEFTVPQTQQTFSPTFYITSGSNATPEARSWNFYVGTDYNQIGFTDDDGGGYVNAVMTYWYPVPTVTFSVENISTA